VDVAKWLIIFVGFVTAVGGLCADWLIPAGARHHLKNPAWKPHAKFHNAQSIMMGFGQGLGAIMLLSIIPLSLSTVIVSAAITSLYWVALMFAPFFPGTAWVDPEFLEGTPRPLGLYPQQIIGYLLLGILMVAVFLAGIGH
jgi:hypothetical protein